MEFSISAYWTGKYREALEASEKLLKIPSTPLNVKEQVVKNLKWIRKKLVDQPLSHTVKQEN